MCECIYMCVWGGEGGGRGGRQDKMLKKTRVKDISMCWTASPAEVWCSWC